MMNNDFIQIVSIMHRRGELLKSAAKTLEDFASLGNSYVWIEKPNGERIIFEKGWKIKTAEILPADIRM